MEGWSGVEGAELGCEMVSDGEEHGEGEEVEVEHGFLPCRWVDLVGCNFGLFLGDGATVEGVCPVLDESKKTREEEGDGEYAHADCVRVGYIG